MGLEEGGRGKAAESVETSEYFVEDDWEPAPRVRVCGCPFKLQIKLVASNDSRERLLEKRIPSVDVSIAKCISRGGEFTQRSCHQHPGSQAP